MMDGLRIKKYADDIQTVKEHVAKYPDLGQIAVLHEAIDDTPYKTKDYLKYMHDEYYIEHNKPHLIEKALKTYPLENQQSKSSRDIIDIIKHRHSTRDYKNQEVPFDVFSNILHYSMGVKYFGKGAYDQKQYPFKYSNSQGGLNYLDLYIIVNKVEKIEQGLYYYDFINNQICLMDQGNMRSILGELTFQNEFTVYGNFTCFIVADLSRVVPKYYKRAYRFSHVDAGILLSYLQLVGENYDVSSCAVAGFLEHKVEHLFDLSDTDYPIVAISFGYKGGSV